MTNVKLIGMLNEIEEVVAMTPEVDNETLNEFAHVISKIIGQMEE